MEKRSLATQDYVQPMPVSLGLPCSKKLYSVIGSILHLYIHVIPIAIPLPHSHYKRSHHFSTTHEDKINNCGFKFSVTCKWHVLIKESKNNS